MKQHGKLVNDNTVRFERLLSGPIERVWSYLVEADKRAQWLCGGATELREGGRIEMQFENGKLSGSQDIERPEKYKDMPDCVSFAGTVTRCEPPKLLAHTWDFDGEPSEVCYELFAQDDKVRLRLTHSRLRDINEKLSICGGWHAHLNILIDVLDGTEPEPFWQQHTRFEAEYAAILKPVA